MLVRRQSVGRALGWKGPPLVAGCGGDPHRLCCVVGLGSRVAARAVAPSQIHVRADLRIDSSLRAAWGSGISGDAAAFWQAGSLSLCLCPKPDCRVTLPASSIAAASAPTTRKKHARHHSRGACCRDFLAARLLPQLHKRAMRSRAGCPWLRPRAQRIRGGNVVECVGYMGKLVPSLYASTSCSLHLAPAPSAEELPTGRPSWTRQAAARRLSDAPPHTPRASDHGHPPHPAA